MKAEEFQAKYGRGKSSSSQTKNKYHAEKVCGYDSKKEFSRAQVLHALAKVGVITELREQVPFILVPAHRDDNGNLVEKAVIYKADFVYKDKSGKLIVEDTKGYRTKEYIIKRKLMLHVFNIKITEI